MQAPRHTGGMTSIIASASPALSAPAIEAAASLIDPVFAETPQYDCEALSAALGVPILLKVESANPIRSFKGRGACCFAADFAPRHDGAPLIAASAGNWGQALAYVCRARGWPLVVYSATSASPLKLARMRALGAEVRLQGEEFGQAKLAARDFAANGGGLFVEDGREPSIAIGAGTLARELTRGAANFDTVLVPLGDGALAAGIGCWLRAHAPGVRIVAVAATGADALAESWRLRRRVVREATHTIADGIAISQPVPEALDALLPLLDEVLLVDDDTMRAAMRLLFEHAGLLAEPAAAVGVAAVLAHPALRSGALATVITGSNLTPTQASQWCLPRSDRLC